MNSPAVDAIAKAILYEGYILYPYRSSAVKNQRRFNFGVIYPRAYAESQTGADSWNMQTECLVEGGAKAAVTVKVRFLRLVQRTAEYVRGCGEGRQVVEVDGRVFENWQEAAEEIVMCGEHSTADLVRNPLFHEFVLGAQSAREEVRDATGIPRAVLLRERQAVRGVIEVSASALEGGAYRVRVRISNLTAAGRGTREEVLALSLLSTHTVMGIRGGDFVSLLDPPEMHREAAQGCSNLGTWPVLVGEQGSRDTLLSSPIILYDYPQVAPESPGDLFDGAEIDEILSLRILTLTDAEKAAMRSSDEQAGRLLDRVESLPPEHFMKLHGVLREVALDRSGDRP